MSSVSMVAFAPSLRCSATPSGAVDSGDATWMISGRGSGDPNPKILGPLSWLVVGSTNYLRVS
jgi:hypothetical protein